MTYVNAAGGQRVPGNHSRLDMASVDQSVQRPRASAPALLRYASACLLMLAAAAPAWAGVKYQLIFSTFGNPEAEQNGNLYVADLQLGGTVLVNIQDMGLLDPDDGVQNIHRIAASPQGIYATDNTGGSVLKYDSFAPGGVTTTEFSQLSNVTDVVVDQLAQRVLYAETDIGTISQTSLNPDDDDDGYDDGGHHFPHFPPKHHKRGFWPWHWPWYLPHHGGHHDDDDDDDGDNNNFIVDLNGPRSLDLDMIGRELYVGQNDRIDVFDLDTGEFKFNVFIGDAIINSLAVDTDNGFVYYTDSLTNQLLATPINSEDEPHVVFDDSVGFFPNGFSQIQEVILDLPHNKLIWTNQGGLIRTADLDRTTGMISNVVDLLGSSIPPIGESLFLTNAEGMEGDDDYTGITMAITFLPDDADFNGDGVVDFEDFVILALHFGTEFGATLDMGDANSDGAVNLSDFDIFGSQMTGSAESLDTLPEPGGLLFMGAASAVVFLRRRRAIQN